jgi:hypothetical protein
MQFAFTQFPCMQFSFTMCRKSCDVPENSGQSIRPIVLFPAHRERQGSVERRAPQREVQCGAGSVQGRAA